MTRETFAERALSSVGCSATHLFVSDLTFQRHVSKKFFFFLFPYVFSPDVFPVVALADWQSEPGDGDPLPLVGARAAVLLRVRGGAHLPLAGEPAHGGRRVAAAHDALQLQLLAGRGHHGVGRGGGDDVANLLHGDARGALWIIK